jgi:hypothetical protein
MSKAPGLLLKIDTPFPKFPPHMTMKLYPYTYRATTKLIETVLWLFCHLKYYGNSQDVPALTNGLRKCGIYTQWNFMQP